MPFKTMTTKSFRFKVKKIPLLDEIEYKRPLFSPFDELYLDLLENKNKLRKNPTKPIFVYDKITTAPDKETVDEDLTLDELEKAYEKSGGGEEQVFKEKDEKKEDKQVYNQQEFQQEEEEEEDEEEREQKERSDLLFKFMVLRRQYPNIEIPEFSEHSDMSNMKRVYEQVIRRVSLDSSVEDYKRYLIGGFMVMEWICTNWMGVDLSGFTNQQVAGLNRYERLLIELGEKNYSSLGSRFPVEVRLLLLIIFNAGLFYVQKIIFSGGETSNILNALFGTMGQQPLQKPKKHASMNGPTITPQEVEELNKTHEKEKDESGGE